MEMIRIKREEVARLRVLRGLKSESAMARVAGLSRQYVSKILNNEDASGVTLGSIEKLCNALDCRIEEIIEHVPASES